MKELFQQLFGKRIRSLVSVSGGRSSLNWKAVCEDGTVMLVKAVPFAKAVPRLRRLIEIYRKIDLPTVPKVLFDGRTFPFGEGELCCLSWMDGRCRAPEDLGAAAAASLVEEYARLSAALHGAVHGDLNYRNMLFKGDRLSAFVDFEMMRAGAPEDDLLRGVLHRAERLGAFAFRRRRRLVRYFRTLVAASGIPAARWKAAIGRYRNRKEGVRRRKSRNRLALALDLAWRTRTFDRFVSALDLV